MIRRKKNNDLSATEKAIIKAPVRMLVNEYNLIKQKKSKLSRHLRNVVEMRIDFLVEKGVIKLESNDKEQAKN